MEYLSLLILGFSDLVLFSIVVLTIVIIGVIYWIISRRYNTGLQEFFIDTIINEHDQAIGLFDDTGNIVLTNKRFAECIGTNSIQLKGKKLTQLTIKPDLFEALTKSDDKIRNNGASQVSYNCKVKKFKSDKWLNIQKRTILQKQSNKKYVLLLITDISEKKTVERRLLTPR